MSEFVMDMGNLAATEIDRVITRTCDRVNIGASDSDELAQAVLLVLMSSVHTAASALAYFVESQTDSPTTFQTALIFAMLAKPGGNILETLEKARKLEAKYAVD